MSSSRDPTSAHRPSLTKREREILLLVAEGHDTKQIAHALGLSPKTIDARVQGMFLKFGINRRAALVWVALEAVHRGRSEPSEERPL